MEYSICKIKINDIICGSETFSLFPATNGKALACCDKCFNITSVDDLLNGIQSNFSPNGVLSHSQIMNQDVHDRFIDDDFYIVNKMIINRYMERFLSENYERTVFNSKKGHLSVFFTLDSYNNYIKYQISFNQEDLRLALLLKDKKTIKCCMKYDTFYKLFTVESNLIDLKMVHFSLDECLLRDEISFY